MEYMFCLSLWVLGRWEQDAEGWPEIFGDVGSLENSSIRVSFFSKGLQNFDTRI